MLAEEVKAEAPAHDAVPYEFVGGMDDEIFALESRRCKWD